MACDATDFSDSAPDGVGDSSAIRGKPTAESLPAAGIRQFREFVVNFQEYNITNRNIQKISFTL